MKNYRIIGHPLNFCLTTPVMNGGFKELGLEAHFETLDLPSEDLPKIMEDLKNGLLDGVVATMPYKTPSIAYLDESSEDVKAINAVNLIVAREGKLHGYNTDWMGAVGAIQSALPDLKDKQVLILGAGGAARATAYGLKKQGAKVAIWNRTPEKAKAFAEKNGLDWVPELAVWDAMPDVIVNATASSDQSRQSTIVPFRLWAKVELALDAVYGKTSLFLEEAKAAKVPHVLSGEIWFLNQVFPMFKILTGQEGPTEKMRALTHEAKDIAN